jgi:hypothetical protein
VLRACSKPTAGHDAGRRTTTSNRRCNPTERKIAWWRDDERHVGQGCELLTRVGTRDISADGRRGHFAQPLGKQWHNAETAMQVSPRSCAKPHRRSGSRAHAHEIGFRCRVGSRQLSSRTAAVALTGIPERRQCLGSRSRIRALEVHIDHGQPAPSAGASAAPG